MTTVTVTTAHPDGFSFDDAAATEAALWSVFGEIVAQRDTGGGIATDIAVHSTGAMTAIRAAVWRRPTCQLTDPKATA